METGAGDERAIASRHGNRGRDQRRLVIVVHGPADHFLGAAVDHGRQIDPALPRRHVRNIAHHLDSGLGGGEVAPHQIWNRRRRVRLIGQTVPPGPRLARHQAPVAHDRADQFRGAALTLAGQLGVHPAVAVGGVRVVEYLLNQQSQAFPPGGGRRFRPMTPLVIARGRHLQPCTHFHHRVLQPAVRCPRSLLRIDELVPSAHRYSWAKKAAAFPRNSFFRRSPRTSFSTSRTRARWETVRGGSSPACSRRYALTQLPSVPSTIPSSRATCAIGRDVSITAFTASSRNSAENFFRRSGILPSPFQMWILLGPLSGIFGAPHGAAAEAYRRWSGLQQGAVGG